jgi:hypothetical protein
MWTAVFTDETKKDLRNIRMNRHQFFLKNESNKNTNVKSEINKLSTNKKCLFLESILPVKETSEQKPNEYSNVDFVFPLKSKNCFVLFLKYVPSDLKSLSSLWCDMRSIRYILCNDMHSYRSGKLHRKSKQ